MGGARYWVVFRYHASSLFLLLEGKLNPISEGRGDPLRGVESPSQDDIANYANFCIGNVFFLVSFIITNKTKNYHEISKFHDLLYP